MMMAFNEVIRKLGIVELSHAWSLEYPGTMAHTLTRDTSDHVPCAITIQTEVPKPRIFRFENFWMEHSSFNKKFQKAWMIPQFKTDPTMRLIAKLKTTRKFLKEWKKELPRLKKTIENTKLLIQFIDIIKEHRDMEIQE
jgi:hypothetical protein